MHDVRVDFVRSKDAQKHLARTSLSKPARRLRQRERHQTKGLIYEENDGFASALYVHLPFFAKQLRARYDQFLRSLRNANDEG